MHWSGWLNLGAGVLGGLLLLWGVLFVVLWVHRHDDLRIRDALRLLPDLIRMWLLLGYLLSPVDLIPDFVPVLGYADDAVVVALTLRAVARHGGPEVLGRHWPARPTG